MSSFTGCLETNEKQWLESDIAPGLLSFEDDDGTIKFSITQLLRIPSKYMLAKLRGVKTTYRGIPAKSWMYEIKTKTADKKNDVTLSIQTYWSGKYLKNIISIKDSQFVIAEEINIVIS